MCRVDVQRRLACGNYSGEGERHSGVGEFLFNFPPESLFTFARNPVHLHPGTIFTFTPESPPDATGRVPLLAWSFLVGLQYLIDECDCSGQLGAPTHYFLPWPVGACEELPTCAHLELTTLKTVLATWQTAN